MKSGDLFAVVVAAETILEFVARLGVNAPPVERERRRVVVAIASLIMVYYILPCDNKLGYGMENMRRR